MRLSDELKIVVEHQISTLISFASISLYGNVFLILKMAEEDPNDRLLFTLINILPFEIFIFIEGNMFLSKYIQSSDSELKIFKGNFWAKI